MSSKSTAITCCFTISPRLIAECDARSRSAAVDSTVLSVMRSLS
jgi:hypothetical protein